MKELSKKKEYGNESITSLKGADRVRKRPAVIFGSDGLEGCKHSVFEIVSNSIDEARDGHGDTIIVTRYNDKSIEVEDFGRGCPVDWNNSEQRYNWELVYCELYAGGKYDNNGSGGDYEYSLGLNGLGACATQYSSEFMDVEVKRDGMKYNLHFEHGENIGGLHKEPLKTNKKSTGTKTRWRADLDVFTDINIEREYFETTLKKQAVVNSGITFLFRWQNDDGEFEETTYLYENGISDYLNEIVGDKSLTAPQFWQAERFELCSLPHMGQKSLSSGRAEKCACLPVSSTLAAFAGADAGSGAVCAADFSFFSVSCSSTNTTSYSCVTLSCRSSIILAAPRHAIPSTMPGSPYWMTTVKPANTPNVESIGSARQDSIKIP